MVAATARIADPKTLRSRSLVLDDDGATGTVADLVNQPAKVMRIGNMIRQLLEEVRAAPLDEASRVR